ncbi:MAG: phosphatidate cytidylyltransferase [Rhizobiales bacterium]|nr:phosphatidate cytidylyltransferase [Hyphomicrobiales bacterium]
MTIGPDLARRTVSALIMIPVVLGVTVWGGVPFVLLWLVAAAAVLYEWSHVARLARPFAYLAVGLIAICAALAALAWGQGAWAVLILLVAALGGALLCGTRRASAMGILVAAAACVPAVVLRGDDRIGLVAILFLYAIVWGTDIGAYFVGRTLGGPKLWPRLSPNKTWSGALGGALIGTFAGCALLWAFGLRVGPAPVVLGLVLSVAGQAGDLAESAFKRAFGVKDAGRLIPGHGGVLDRLDGFTAAVLVAVAVGLLRGLDAPAAGLLLW